MSLDTISFEELLGHRRRLPPPHPASPSPPYPTSKKTKTTPYLDWGLGFWRRGGRRSETGGGRCSSYTGIGQRENRLQVLTVQGDSGAKRMGQAVFVHCVCGNGKPIVESSKVAVRSRSYQWSEAFAEFVWIAPDETSKEMEDCFFKLVVAMDRLDQESLERLQSICRII